MITKQNEKTSATDGAMVPVQTRSAFSRLLKEGIMKIPCVGKSRAERLKAAMENAKRKQLDAAKEHKSKCDLSGLDTIYEIYLDRYPSTLYERIAPGSTAGYFTLVEIAGTRETRDDTPMLELTSTVFEVLPNGGTKTVIKETACIYEQDRLDMLEVELRAKRPETLKEVERKQEQWRGDQNDASLMCFVSEIGEKPYFEIGIRDGRYYVPLKDARKLKNDEEGRLILGPKMVVETDGWGGRRPMSV